MGIIMRTFRINSNSQIPAKRKNSTFFLSPAELGETLLYIYFIVFAHHVPSIRHIPQQYTQQAEDLHQIRAKATAATALPSSCGKVAHKTLKCMGF